VLAVLDPDGSDPTLHRRGSTSSLPQPWEPLQQPLPPGSDLPPIRRASQIVMAPSLGDPVRAELVEHVIDLD
jgi:hypothetical protein